MKKLRYKIYKKVIVKQEIRKIISMSLILLTMMITFLILSCTILFKIKKVNIVGISDERVNQVQEILNTDIGKNLLLYDIREHKENILKSIPFVDNVLIMKKFPYTLSVNVINADKIGVIEHENHFIVISQSGNEVCEIDNNDEKLPVILGLYKDGISPETDNMNKLKRSNFLTLLNSLRNHDIKNVTGYDISLITDISFEYDRRIKVNVGTIDDIDYKLSTAKNILEEKIDVNDSGTLDVSSSSDDKHSYFIPSEENVNEQMKERNELI